MKDGTSSKPVFIVGMNGSGTTMLLDCLGRHRNLYGFPLETRLIPYFIASQRSYGDLADDRNFRRLWGDLLGMPAFRLANGGCKPALPEDWQDYGRDLASIIDGSFRLFSDRMGKHRWLEKTPQHVQHIESLAALFPRAVFLHVLRDGRDCAASFYRRWRRTPELTLYRWKNVIREGRRQGSRLGEGRYLEIRYETLTEDPEAGLRQICDFIREPFDPAILASSEPYFDSTSLEFKAPTGRLRPNSGRWRKTFPPKTIGSIERIAGAALSEFGYHTSQAKSDYDPPGYTRRFWRGKDYLRQYTREILLRMGGRTQRSWRAILALPLTALRQSRVNKY